MEDNIFFATHPNFTSSIDKSDFSIGPEKKYLFLAVLPQCMMQTQNSNCAQIQAPKKRKKNYMHSHIQRYYERWHRDWLKFDFSAYTHLHFLFTLANFFPRLHEQN